MTAVAGGEALRLWLGVLSVDQIAKSTWREWKVFQSADDIRPHILELEERIVNNPGAWRISKDRDFLELGSYRVQVVSLMGCGTSFNLNLDESLDEGDYLRPLLNTLLDLKISQENKEERRQAAVNSFKALREIGVV